MPSKKKQIFEGWFSISTGQQSDVEDRVHDRFGPRGDDPEERQEWLRKRFIDEEGVITKKGWDALNEDIGKLESNTFGWLRESLENAWDEGHGDRGELIGGFSFDARNGKQLELVLIGVEHGISSSDPELDKRAWKGVSRFGIAVLDVDVYLNVDKDDLLKANAIATWKQTERERSDR